MHVSQTTENISAAPSMLYLHLIYSIFLYSTVMATNYKCQSNSPVIITLFTLTALLEYFGSKQMFSLYLKE